MESKARLLFVDDEERVVNLLRMMFRNDYEVFTATSGRQALEIIASQAIDVIVSDQRMPEMVGIELLSQVRKRSPATMRILLTGYSDLAAIVGSINDGEVFRFVNKPWDQQEIKAIIAEAAQIAQATGVEAATPMEADTAPAGMPVEGPELLVIDDSVVDRQAMAQIVGADYKVHGASSFTEALKILEQRDVGVIVAEARVGGNDTRELLRILKRHYPAITTIMMTQLADADVVIKLINEAQIYRVATKPIRSGVFQIVVAAAMKQHMRYRSRPSLVKRNAVAASAEPENASLAASVVRSLAGLRDRMARLVR
ncbi:MAG TPA: response regulator [Albitalea sp.]|uniref:response regulator n=1 Tax=Piscinibacter sp. TaxID=1903157 RepID=UPI002ED5A5FE